MGSTRNTEGMSAERIEQLLDIEQEHKNLMELRTNGFHLQPGLMDLSLQGDTARLFAAGVVSLFKDNGAINNFEVQISLRDPAEPHDHYLLLVQRLNRPTPAEQRAAALAHVAVFREALEWYAEPSIYQQEHFEGTGMEYPALVDGGHTARAALAAAEAQP